MVEDRHVRVKRSQSAILAADVAGYSRLIHHDEAATYVKLTVLLADAVTPAISEHGGRIVKNTGDGFLAVFPSAVPAVRAAVQFQTRIKELTADAEEGRIAFRVGINVGDVIVEAHDVFGESVNIAARLETIVEPGGICISSSACDHSRGKVGIEFADLGEQLMTLQLFGTATHCIGIGSESDRSVVRLRAIGSQPKQTPPDFALARTPEEVDLARAANWTCGTLPQRAQQTRDMTSGRPQPPRPMSCGDAGAVPIMELNGFT
jgi:class 3 adenylate cyclase